MVLMVFERSVRKWAEFRSLLTVPLIDAKRLRGGRMGEGLSDFDVCKMGEVAEKVEGRSLLDQFFGFFKSSSLFGECLRPTMK
jgi:hypothetical protein